MMPWNFLILPLLGGFIFCITSNLTRFVAARSDGQRLILYAALFGICLIIIAATSQICLKHFCPGTYKCYACWWHNNITKEPYSAPTVLSFLIAAPLSAITCIFYSRAKAIGKAITLKSDPMEIVLLRCRDERRLIAISLKNGKYYIGYLSIMINPAQSLQSISIIPQLSGYRDPDTKAVDLTTDYTSAREIVNKELEKLSDQIRSETNKRKKEKLESTYNEKLRIDQFQLAIFTSEIQSLNLFNPKIFKEHFATQSRKNNSNQNPPSLFGRILNKFFGQAAQKNERRSPDKL